MAPFHEIARLLNLVLSRLVDVTGSTGSAIILLAVMLQALLYLPIRSWVGTQQRMLVIQPELEALKRKHQGDQEQLQAEVMALWKRYDYNPIGGCLPLFLWIGVVLATWQTFRFEPATWRDAHFLWIAPGPLHESHPAIFARNLGGFDAALFLALGLLSGLAYLWSRSAETARVMGIFAMGIVQPWPSGMVLYWGTFSILQILLHPKRVGTTPVPDKSN